jgi:hypothetical protein
VGAHQARDLLPADRPRRDRVRQEQLIGGISDCIRKPRPRRARLFFGRLAFGYGGVAG